MKVKLKSDIWMLLLDFFNAAYLTALMVRPLKRLLERFPKCTFTFSKSNSRHQAFTGLAVYTVDVQ